MTIIDGKKVSQEIRNDLKSTVKNLKKNNIDIALAVIVAGDDDASAVYVKNKILACNEIGIVSHHYKFDSNVTKQQLISLIEELNHNPKINGILVQLPLPKHLSERDILSTIDPTKDVDGFSACQMGKLVLGEKGLYSCTPSGIMELLRYYNISIEGKNAVVVGRSTIVGKPMALMLTAANATVTVCHSKTQNLGEITQTADILVVAIGRGRFITADMVKKGAVVIDVGMNKIDGQLCGDVDFDNVKQKCSFITPVPGGVGPMTVTMLLKNTISAAKNE